MSVVMETGSSEGSRATGGKRQGPPTLPRRRSRLREESANENELEELRTAFALFDKDDDGIICRKDLASALEQLGHPVNEQIVDKIIKNAGNRRGEIHEDSFVLWMQRMGSNNNGDEAVLRNAFSVLDRDGDGLLSMNDMKNGFTLLGEHISDKMMEVMFKEADRNGNGRVSYDDFASILRK